MDIITYCAHHYAMIIVLMGCGIIGMLSGMVGAFSFLRRQSLLGDAVSHAALPGMVIALLITADKSPLILMTGGLLSGTIGTLLTWGITHITGLRTDTVLGVILSVFFGLGILFISIMQKYPRADQAILNKFLFGNSALLLMGDVAIIAAVGLIMGVIILAFWKELVLYSFDPSFARSAGYSTMLLQIIMTMLFVSVIAIGLQCIGVILMSSLLIAPAAAARQWTYRVRTMLILAMILGGSASIIGVWIADKLTIPTGPAIVVIASVIVFGSLIIRMITPRIKRPAL